jgi:hypothetical protein
MSTVQVINVKHPSSASNNIVLDSSGNATMAGTMAMATPFAMRNRVINGAMEIDQRNAGASVTIGATTGTYTLDRWGTQSINASKFSVQQNAGSVTTPAGFINYLGITSLAATSPGSTDYYSLYQPIEGLNVTDLAWGTANAKTVTLSFWVYSSLTGTFSGSFANSGASRSYPFTYTISAANIWEYKTITVAGDTTGTWLTTNGIGVYIRFDLGCGSSFRGTANTWAGANYYGATSAVSVVGTNGATFYLTGVQLEVGTVATPFERRLYPQELAMCQRYYYRRTATGSNDIIATMQAYSTAGVYGLILFLPVELRADGGTVGVSSFSHIAPGNGNGTTQASFTGSSSILASKRSVSTFAGFSGSSGLTLGMASTIIFTTASGWIDVSAEL